MMTPFRYQPLRRLRWWLLIRLCRPFDMIPVPFRIVAHVKLCSIQAIRLCDESGFLRDGRYPGGRHAERKLRGRLAPISRFPTPEECWRFPNAE